MTRATVTTFLMAGTSGAIVSAIALAVLGQVFAGTPLAAFNATAHWLFGDAAALRPAFSLPVTATGVATHGVACFFWGAILVTLLRATGARRAIAIFLCAFLVSLLAMVIDYGVLPEALSPGWHLVLPDKAVIAGFLALGAGLGLGVTSARNRA